jgi:TOMM system kinase/cyclase fusion protein
MSEPTTFPTSFDGSYELLAELSRGSFGRVYRARRRGSDRLVALKTMRAAGEEQPAARTRRAERFRRATALHAELTHPNIVRLVDSGEAADGSPYAAFELVRGRTLREVLDAEGALSWREACRLMAQVLDALACAHASDIVHRDLKPENVMITETGARRNAVVLDFGLGAFTGDRAHADGGVLTGMHEMLGTPCYAAPEQLRGEPPTPAADLYSWGLVFLECVTGRRVMSGATPQEVVHEQLGLEPLALPPCVRDLRLRRLLEATVEKAPERRRVGVEALLDALESAAVATCAAEPAGTVDAEQRQVTVVCCGITFASRRGRAFDVEELDHLVRVEHAVLGEIAGRTGGVVTDALADQVMLVYGYPHASEDDARRAAGAAVQILAQAGRWSETQGQERGLRLEVRIGVHTGLVIARPDGGGLRDLVGLTPQVAARLKALAQPGEALATDDTRRLLRDELVVEPAGEHAIAELSRALPVVRLLGVRRGTTPSPSGDQESPLLGRPHEVARLEDLWARAQAGAGAAILVTGEPGMGKSRLVRELRRRVPAGSWLECRSLPENAHTPLRPLNDLLATLDTSLAALLGRYGFDLDETLPLLATALSLPCDAPAAPPNMTPDRQKEVVLDTLVRLVFAIAREHPVVFVVEDLHWADPTTIELVTMLVREAQARRGGDDGAARIAVVCTARPGVAMPLGAAEASTLHLTGLARTDVEALVRVRLGDGAVLPDEVVEQVVRRADGVPLYVEEVARMLAESGFRDDDAAGIPSSLRDLLAARFDALSPGARAVAQAAAVLGREFTDDLLRATAEKDEIRVRADLRELVDAGLVLPRRSVRRSTWVFKHMLLRDAAYETMVRSRRSALHRRAGETLRALYPDVEAQRPELLAHHFEQAGDGLVAAELWKAAGDRTMARGAYVESLQQFERGLGVLRPLPEDAARWRRELALTESLGTALLATRGYSSPDVEAAFDRAVALGDRLGETDQIRVLYGIWGVRLTRADRDGTASLLPRFRRHGESHPDDPVSMLSVHGALGIRAFFDGDLLTARDEMRQSLRWYDTDGYRRFVRAYGYDGGLYNYGYLAWSLQLLGEPDAAARVADDLLARAEANRSPYGVAMALCFRGILARDRGDVATAVAMADRAIALAVEQKLYYWLGSVTCLRGWASIRLGDAEAGIAEVERGLSLFDLIGLRATFGYHLAALAEARLARGEDAEALAVLDRGLALCATSLDRFYEPELLRLRGETLARSGALDQAEAALRASLDLARTREGRWFELRAATSFAKLLRGRDQHAVAHGVLSNVYQGFREGFETLDLQVAREVLATLA